MSAQSVSQRKIRRQGKPGLGRHVASALLIFVMLQILIISETGGYLSLHLGMIVAIGLFALAGRALEKKWPTRRLLEMDKETSRALKTDLLIFWSTSIAAPFLLVPVATVLARF
jgi:hypothetical protein